MATAPCLVISDLEAQNLGSSREFKNKEQYVTAGLKGLYICLLQYIDSVNNISDKRTACRRRHCHVSLYLSYSIVQLD